MRFKKVVKTNTNKLHKFDRLERLIGRQNLNQLQKKSVLVLGCGGVGGYVVEALARSNIGTLILVDFDQVEETNLNRQIVALQSNIGKDKVELLKERIHDINENCEVISIKEFITEDNISMLFDYSIDYFVDACDSVSTKKCVIRECLKRKIPFLSCMGTAKKLDPSKLEITDIRKTKNDPLARIIRKYVKEEGYKQKIEVLSSTEIPRKTEGLGSSIFVPASAGLFIASHVLQKLLKEKS